MALFNEVLLKVYLFKIFVQVAYSLLNSKPVDWSTVTQSTGKVFQRLCMFSVSLCLFVLEIFFSRKLGGMSSMEAAREHDLQHMFL